MSHSDYSDLYLQPCSPLNELRFFIGCFSVTLAVNDSIKVWQPSPVDLPVVSMCCVLFSWLRSRFPVLLFACFCMWRMCFRKTSFRVSSDWEVFPRWRQPHLSHISHRQAAADYLRQQTLYLVDAGLLSLLVSTAVDCLRKTLCVFGLPSQPMCVSSLGVGIGVCNWSGANVQTGSCCFTIWQLRSRQTWKQVNRLNYHDLSNVLISNYIFLYISWPGIQYEVGAHCLK